MRSEKYLTTLLDVMYVISNSHGRYIHPSEYRKMSGIYIKKIEDELINNDVVVTRFPRPLRSDNDLTLLGYIEEIESELERIRQKQDDRKLDNRYKTKGIQFGGWGLAISIASMLLSIFNLLRDLDIL